MTEHHEIVIQTRLGPEKRKQEYYFFSGKKEDQTMIFPKDSGRGVLTADLQAKKIEGEEIHGYQAWRVEDEIHYPFRRSGNFSQEKKGLMSNKFRKKIFFFLPLLLICLSLPGCNTTKTVSTVPSPVPTQSSVKESSGVPLPTQEDVVRTFISLIAEKRISEAVGMMDVSDESEKQAWGVQLNSFESIALKNIEKNGEDTFKVTLTVKMSPNSANGPIPYYGYENGDNIRWIGLKKGSDNLWKITGFATSP